MKVTKKQRRKRGAGARERNDRPHVYHQVLDYPTLFLLELDQIRSLHICHRSREVLLLRRIEVAGSSSQEMEDRVRMRIGDTG